MAEISVFEVGDPLTFTPATAGIDTLANDGATLLLVIVQPGGTPDVTFASQTDCDHGHGEEVGTPEGVDRVVSPSAGLTTIYGPFNPVRYNDSGFVEITTTDEVNVSYAGLRIPASF